MACVSRHTPWGRGVLFAASIHVAMPNPNCHILEVTQGYIPMMWELFNEPSDIRPDSMVHAPDRPASALHCTRMRWSDFAILTGPSSSSSAFTTDWLATLHRNRIAVLV